MSHTPGPWHIEVTGHRSAGGTWWAEYKWILSHGVNSHGDGPEGDIGTVTSTQEDAALIAAAPDLLGALEAILQLGRGDQMIHAHTIAELAIAKATNAKG